MKTSIPGTVLKDFSCRLYLCVQPRGLSQPRLNLHLRGAGARTGLRASGRQPGRRLGPGGPLPPQRRTRRDEPPDRTAGRGGKVRDAPPPPAKYRATASPTPRTPHPVRGGAAIGGAAGRGRAGQSAAAGPAPVSAAAERGGGSRPAEWRLLLGAAHGAPRRPPGGKRPSGGGSRSGGGGGAARAWPGRGGDAAPRPRPASPGSSADFSARSPPGPAGAASQGGAGNRAPTAGRWEQRWVREPGPNTPAPVGEAAISGRGAAGASSAFGRVVVAGLFLLLITLLLCRVQARGRRDLVESQSAQMGNYLKQW